MFNSEHVLRNDWKGLLELLNKVSRLSLLEILLVRTNHKSRFVFNVVTVLLASSGYQVSCNTTGGGVVMSS